MRAADRLPTPQPRYVSAKELAERTGRSQMYFRRLARVVWASCTSMLKRN
jgi:hypothetical protein